MACVSSNWTTAIVVLLEYSNNIWISFWKTHHLAKSSNIWPLWWLLPFAQLQCWREASSAMNFFSPGYSDEMYPSFLPAIAKDFLKTFIFLRLHFVLKKTKTNHFNTELRLEYLPNECYKYMNNQIWGSALDTIGLMKWHGPNLASELQTVNWVFVYSIMTT